MSAIKLRDLANGYLHFLLFAKSEDERGRECAEHAEARHPPDVPDERKASDDGKECCDESGGAVLGHLNWLVLARLSGLVSFQPQSLLPVPKGVVLSDMG